MKNLTRAQEVYRQIKHEIVTCRLLPGTPLFEQELSLKLNVSRTPVREALRILEVEGLVEVEAHRGAQVAKLSRQAIQDAYEARIWVEPNVAAKVAKLADEALIRKLEAAIEKMPVEPENHEEAVAAIQADLEFHRLIVEAAGNRLVKDLIENARANTGRIAYFIPPGRYQQARDEHRAILDAIRAQDGEKAKLLMKHHIEAAARRMFVYSADDANDGS